MTVKKGNTYYQDRRKERIDPILLKVLNVIDPDCSGHEICKVRWHILGKDKVYASVFPMVTIKIGEFADFKPMPKELYLECMNILKTVEVYKNAKRRIVYSKQTLIYSHTPSIDQQKVDDLFFELQKWHRSNEQQLNRIKYNIRRKVARLSIDGKIIMECYNDLFAFFTRMLRTQLAKYRLANSLLVYISGGLFYNASPYALS